MVLKSGEAMRRFGSECSPVKRAIEGALRCSPQQALTNACFWTNCTDINHRILFGCFDIFLLSEPLKSSLHGRWSQLPQKLEALFLLSPEWPPPPHKCQVAHRCGTGGTEIICGFARLHGTFLSRKVARGRTKVSFSSLSCPCMCQLSWNHQSRRQPSKDSDQSSDRSKEITVFEFKYALYCQSACLRREVDTYAKFGRRRL